MDRRNAVLVKFGFKKVSFNIIVCGFGVVIKLFRCGADTIMRLCEIYVIGVCFNSCLGVV